MTKQTGRWSKHINQFIILSIVWLSLAVRLIYLAYINESPSDEMLFAPLCGIDAHIYDQSGQDALSGLWPDNQPLERTPIYPLYLIFNYSLFGVNHYTPLIIQALIQAITVAALYSVGRFAFSEKAGLLAALGFALYGSIIFYTGCFAQVSLVMPLLTLTLFFLLKFKELNRLYHLIFAGLTLGMVALGRPNLLLLLPAAIGWLWRPRQPWPQWVRLTAYFTGAVLLVIFPFTLHNYKTSGNFILVSKNGPVNLFISNNADAEGRDILAPGIVQPIHRRLEIVVAGIERHETTFTREVIRYIEEESLDWVKLQLKKLWLLFGKSDLNILTVAFAYPTTDRQIAIFKAMPIQWHGLIIAAFLGMALIRRKHTSLLLLFFTFITLATIIFFVQLRFRLLLTPIVFLYAAALLAEAPLWFRSARYKFYLVLFILLFCLPVTPNVWPFGLALIGIGVWQTIQRKFNTDPKTDLSFSFWPLLAVWSLFVLAILAAQVIISMNRIGQSEDYYLGPEIVGNTFLGQTFQPDCDGLNRIRLTMGIHNETHNQPVTFHLQSQTTGRDILVSYFTTENLKDRTIKEFTFFPQPNSSQQTYLAYMISPTSHPGNSITLRGFSDLPMDWYPHGTAIVGQANQTQPFPGDLAFTAFCDAGLLQTIDTAFTRLPGPTWFYWAILIGHAGLLIAALYPIITKRSQNNLSMSHNVGQ